MPSIRPFRALRYDPAKVGDLTKVVTQPYDRIDPALQETYYARHPNNAVRLVLAKGDRYAATKRTLAEWLASGVVVEDDAPSFYLMQQEYATPWGERRTRRGIAAMTLAEPFGQGRVKPHEHTHDKPKEDRFKLLTEARSHFGHVFLLYSDPKRSIGPHLDAASAGPPLLEARDDHGDRHRVWRISDPAAVKAIQKDLEKRDAIVADGHHRYETACTFRQANGPGRGDKPHDYVLATLVNTDEPGLTILGTHRAIAGVEEFDADALVEGVGELFTARESGGSWEEFVEDIRFEGFGHPAFGLLLPGQPRRLLVDAERRFAGKLDVSVLHAEVLEKTLGITLEDTRAERYVTYHRDGADVDRRVQAGEFQCAFLVNPVTMAQMRALVDRGERFPQKTTDFIPKMISGLVMSRLDGWMA